MQHVLIGLQHGVGIGAAAEQQVDNVRTLHLAGDVEDGRLPIPRRHILVRQVLDRVRRRALIQQLAQARGIALGDCDNQPAIKHILIGQRRT